MQSDDRGDHWQAVKTPYAGSLTGAVFLPSGALAVSSVAGVRILKALA